MTPVRNEDGLGIDACLENIGLGIDAGLGKGVGIDAGPNRNRFASVPSHRILLLTLVVRIMIVTYIFFQSSVTDRLLQLREETDRGL